MSGARAAQETEVMQELRRDHLNVAKLLNVLDQQISQVHGDERPDYVLMADILHYMTEYTDLFHHPKEDLVFERLIARDATLQGDVDNLIKEHKGLATKGAAFLDMLQRVTSEQTMVSRDEIAARGLDYVEFLRSHMQKEESGLFRHASEMLTARDSKEIQEHLKSPGDPLFGEAIKDAYRLLYTYISEHSAGA